MNFITSRTDLYMKLVTRVRQLYSAYFCVFHCSTKSNSTQVRRFHQRVLGVARPPLSTCPVAYNSDIFLEYAGHASNGTMHVVKSPSPGRSCWKARFISA